MGRIEKIQGEIINSVSKNIFCAEKRNSILLEGEVETYEEVIKAGKLATNRGYKGVINNIKVKGLTLPSRKHPKLIDNKLERKKVDVLIIGGGVIGSAIARELSKWEISILLIDKEDDLAVHASSRNNGMIHPGIDPNPKTKKAYYNVQGNKLYSKVAKELDVSFERCGNIVLYDAWYGKIISPVLKLRARLNGVEGMKYLSKRETKELEPYIYDDFIGSVIFPTTGIVSPYKMTIAFAENAVLNGAEVSLNTAALSIKCEDRKIIYVDTNRGRIFPKIVINAAGVHADEIAEMADDRFFTIHPRKGHILILDKKKGQFLNSIVSKPAINQSKSGTKGGGVTKTIDGNILVGPDAVEQPFKEDYSTNKENIDNIINKHFPILPLISPSDIITYFSGNRAATYEEDFIIEKSEYVKNLIHAAGIQSPGLASAPAIALDIEKMAVEVLSTMMEVKPKEKWNPYRKGIPELFKMSEKERNEYIKKRPDYGIIICRCEEISKGEIVDAINSPIPVNSLDAIKRRVRPGMGRCQGAFCTPSVAKIIEENANKNILEITKKGGESYLVVEETKKGGGAQFGIL
ncbi:NAD(P)/FAD-dependent oxidoreductase [Caloramator quimbayensis]|uniref:NAD(P)/FAD-dependent oxidoreductase n=1 Tax=Caloramator quimbayensis TaxID=1147123 RepID=UPI001A9A3F1E|nr:NAD(P)/FAD-dependent oxidoreductase [Caloramator quimbayensis]